MSFLFPANPADGDIVVQPQPDGSFIKGTYDAANNLWAVGELPEEPGVPGPEGPKGDQGDKGDPGKGIAISGVVDTEANLPPANDHIFQFYIVDDVNHVYYSDGFQWFDLGGPIVGPQGPAGLDGTNGTDGIDGAPGKGWTSTTIIDERPTSYQVRFNSDDGLGFVTDNILGPQGETGSLAVATANTIGGIKIGRGLNIKPDGTASAGETNVDLETVPLQPEGTVYNYTLGFVPGYFNAADNQTFSTTAYAEGNSSTQTGTITVPGSSNGGIIYFFTGSDVSNNFSPPGGYGLQWTVYAQLKSLLTLQGANWVSESATLGQMMVHNYSIGSETRRTSNQTTFKVGQATWPMGTTEIGVQIITSVLAAQRASVGFGRCRVIVEPFKSDDSYATLTLDEIRARFQINPLTIEPSDSVTDIEPPTPEEINETNAADLRKEVIKTLEQIDQATVQTYTSGTTYDLLMSTRQEIVNLATLPGTFEDINNEYERLAEIVKPYVEIIFRFETTT
jgi:hypothetical protein